MIAGQGLKVGLSSCFDVAAEAAAEKVLFVIPSEARDLFFFSTPKKQQIPRAILSGRFIIFLS
ncbi:MAG TPA: hypothetical protein VHS29_02885, partial [Candidatus Acidoferrales bacterium]|nr:hypothetical protein [Candidatus Acidoferrales bacterium]